MCDPSLPYTARVLDFEEHISDEQRAINELEQARLEFRALEDERDSTTNRFFIDIEGWKRLYNAAVLRGDKEDAAFFRTFKLKAHDQHWLELDEIKRRMEQIRVRVGEITSKAIISQDIENEIEAFFTINPVDEENIETEDESEEVQ